MDEQVGSGATPEIQPPMGEAEKMLSQSEVNALIARVKQASVAKGRQEAEREYQERLEKQNRDSEIHPPVQAQIDAALQQYEEKRNREMQEHQLRTEAANLASMYEARVSQSRSNYEDFDTVTKGFDPSNFPNLVYLVAGMENAGDIIYDLLKDKRKLVTVNDLARTAPQLAQLELARLSQSISANRAALAEAGQHSISEPLSPLTPSRVSGSNGKMSISDLRKQSYLRG